MARLGGGVLRVGEIEVELRESGEGRAEQVLHDVVRKRLAKLHAALAQRQARLLQVVQRAPHGLGVGGDGEAARAPQGDAHALTASRPCGARTSKQRMALVTYRSAGSDAAPHLCTALVSSAECIFVTYTVLSTRLFSGAAAASTAAAAGAAPPATSSTTACGQPGSLRASASENGPESCATTSETVETKQCMLAVLSARRHVCLSTKKVSSRRLLIIAPCTPLHRLIAAVLQEC